MRAYKWLNEGAHDPAGGTKWSTDTSIRNATALTTSELSRGVARELWEVELEGDLTRSQPRPTDLPGALTAERGRLVRRIDGWEHVAPELAREWTLRACRAHAKHAALAGGALAADEPNTSGKLRAAAGHLSAAADAADMQVTVAELQAAADAGKGLVVSSRLGWDQLSQAYGDVEVISERSKKLAKLASGIASNPGTAAASDAAELSAEIAGGVARAEAIFERNDILNETVRAIYVGSHREHARISDELRERIGLEPTPPDADAGARTIVPTPETARIGVFFFGAIGLTVVAIAVGLLIAAGSLSAVEDEYGMPPAVTVAFIAAGIPLLVLALLVIRLSKAVRARRWAGYADRYLTAERFWT